MAPLQLSTADAKVLVQVFDPESGPRNAAVVVDPDQPSDRHLCDEAVQVLKQKERHAIAVVEQYESARERPQSKHEPYVSALRILDDVIKQNPTYASALNNRAQLRRWRYGDRFLMCQSKAREDPERAAAGIAVVHDLQSCIALTAPDNRQSAVSPAQGRLLAQAYTQLAAVYLAASKDLDSPSVMNILNLGAAFGSREQLEEEASKYFYLGGLYGNEVAKALAVQINPHAKLCGNIVREAMCQEIAEVS